MTPDEFQANCIALSSLPSEWQAEIAYLLGVDPNTIRKAAKFGPSDNLARAVLDLMGEPVSERVHAEWIYGDGDDGRKYLVHTRFPRFRCMVVAFEDDYDILTDESGVFQMIDVGLSLAAFHWQDRRPDGLIHLMEQAADALEQFQRTSCA